MLAVVVWSGLAIAAAMLAGLLALLKRRDVSAWMAWGFLVPPAVLLFMLAPRNTGPRPRQPSLDQLDAAF
jgi:hypothetical protein